MNGMNFLNTEKGKQFILLALAALGIIGGVAWYYDYNQWTIHQACLAKTAKLKTDIATAQQLALTVAQTADLRVQMQQFVDAHEATMVSGDQFAWVIREISQLAESQSVGNVITQPGAVIPHARKSAYSWYVTHLEFSGNYDQIAQFIQTLENHFPEAEIRSVTIAMTEAAGSQRAGLDLALLVQPVVTPKIAPKS